ncbi:MAG: threonine synthase [Clostridia bacterium]|nr:threonine synthase [Clostridia bacterium]
MKFTSTRNDKIEVTGCEAVVKGLSEEGGLFVPAFFPVITSEDMARLSDMDYAERASFIIAKYLDDLPDLNKYTQKAYERFDGDPTPVTVLGEGLAILELWHGPTHAFKDVALTLLPYLLTGSKKVVGKSERTLILVATSGDTGKAALEGFKDVEGTDVIVFYPSDGVSNLQKLQMMTQSGDNVCVCAVTGNFDDAQSAVKKVFTDEQVKERLKSKNFALSSANSINFGRLVPQVAYYFSAYLDLLNGGEIKEGEKINFVVPTGNFGNILAGYYAMKMGLPVNKLICASNDNNVLTEFIQTGRYDTHRSFHKTSSPSMDILISSNLERLLFELSGRDCELTAKRMESLAKTGAYEIEGDELSLLQKHFYAEWADEEEVSDEIGELFDETGYIMDTHTAVALNVYDKYIADTDDETFTVVLSTASPYKFVSAVLDAIGEKVPKSDADALALLEEVTALDLPRSLSELPTLKKRFTSVIDKDEIKDFVLDYIAKQ